jgi:hypothetical protein
VTTRLIRAVREGWDARSDLVASRSNDGRQ